MTKNKYPNLNVTLVKGPVNHPVEYLARFVCCRLQVGMERNEGERILAVALCTLPDYKLPPSFAFAAGKVVDNAARGVNSFPL